MSSLSMILLLIVLVLGWLDEANKTEWFLYICKGWGGLVRDLLAVDWLLALSAHSSSQAAVSSTPSWLPYTGPPPPSPSPPVCLSTSHFHANQYVHMKEVLSIIFMQNTMWCVWRKSWVSLCTLTGSFCEKTLVYWEVPRKKGVTVAQPLHNFMYHAAVVN